MKGDGDRPLDITLEDATQYRHDRLRRGSALVFDVFRGLFLLRLHGCVVKRLQRVFETQSRILDQLTEVSLALSSERDHRTLLSLILSRAILLAGCDAGSLYLLIHDEDESKEKRLLFAAAQNNSRTIHFRETELAVTNSSLAGFVATTGETIAIEDAYAIPSEAPYRFNRVFDEKTGYRTKSLLVLPMKNNKGEITGVLQLINHKQDPSASLTDLASVEKQVTPFDVTATRLCQTVGSMAAVAIDNNRLYESIERLFEGFVKASVTAIEQRDPTTSGHSSRVAILTVELAQVVDRVRSGVLAHESFTPDQMRELRYASLLHDFGKVGVSEQVLTKAKKLYSGELERVMERLESARLYAERDMLLKKIELLRRGAGSDPRTFTELDEALGKYLAELDTFGALILRSNEPTVLPEGDFSTLQAIGAATFKDRHGCEHALLNPEECRKLSIRKGSLSESERLEIESHVTHTFEFLSKIPWTTGLKGVPAIAYLHHEKLDGRGYPRHLGATALPIQSRMMTIADIYDALSAADRPYKKAITLEKALDILNSEVKGGMLDPSLVDLFIESKVYEKTLHLLGGVREP